MNTQNLSTIQMIQLFSHKCKCHFLLCCPTESIRFLCKGKINLLKRKLKGRKRHHMAKFQNEARLLSLKRSIWKQRKEILASKKAYSSIKLLLFPSLTNCLAREQFVLIPASVWSKSLKTQSLTKRELPKYQPSRNPTYQIDSLKKVRMK